MSEMLDKLSETVGALCEEYGRQLLELRQERDQLRAELTAAKNLLARIHRDGGHHTEAVGFAQSVADADGKVLEWPLAAEERTALAAHVEALKKALGNLILDCQRGPGFTVSKPYRKTITEAQSAISSYPAQSLAAHDAAVKVAVLREVASEVEQIKTSRDIDTVVTMRDYIADSLRAKADRIEKEAANG